jgi:hypothetical protein
LSHSTEIDKCIGLTENNCLQSMIPEKNMTSSIDVYKQCCMNYHVYT